MVVEWGFGSAGCATTPAALTTRTEETERMAEDHPTTPQYLPEVRMHVRPCSDRRTWEGEVMASAAMLVVFAGGLMCGWIGWRLR